MKRTATAVWNGTGKEGNGTLTTQSNALNKAPYTWKSRFEEETGTNPEELIAAAHAGCFTMKLTFVLAAAGFPPETIETTCAITLDKTINNSHLVTKVKAGAITIEKLHECVEDAKANCPVSKALGIEITAEASLA
ncbi:MAG: OsmC family peroxiredoxin [Bacteroidia bacterium]